MITREEINDFDILYNYVEDDEIYGYLEIRIIDGVIDIINVYTNEEYRRQGVATKLISYMLENEEYSRVMLEVNEDNNEAFKLYRKLGFEEISIRERYYGSNSAIIMQKVRKWKIYILWQLNLHVMKLV